MNEKTYYELTEELNENDFSVGLVSNPMDLELLTDILTPYGYKEIEIKHNEAYFKSDDETFTIKKNGKGEWDVYKLIIL